MEFALNIPINRTSLGNVSFCILYEIYKKKLSPAVFPISEVDLSSFEDIIDDEFKKWLSEGIKKAQLSHSRNNPACKIWHLQDTSSFSKKQILYSFHELDQVTQLESNVVKNNEKVIFPCKYNVNVFNEYGCKNTTSIPLGFDSLFFHKKEKEYHDKKVIHFSLVGKLEKRKQHFKTLRYWAEEFGNKREFVLNCAIYNPFMKPEHQQALINEALQGKRYWNINFIPFMQSNSVYNDFLNNTDIVLGCGTESWSLPPFQAVSIGKHSVILDIAGHKEWANSKNSSLFSPNGKEPCYDNIFFKEGAPTNQGSIYTFSKEDFIKACYDAINKFLDDPVNKEGFKLQEKFTYEKTTNSILKELENLNE